MAKRVDLQQAFTDPDDAATATDDADTAKKTSKKTTGKQPTAKKTAKKAPAKKQASDKRTPPAKKTAPTRTSTTDTPPWATDEVIVRATDTKSTKPFNVGLHPDDLQALDMAKALNGADRQARIRTMVALWRGDRRFRDAVEKLAKTAPRGGY